MTKRKSFFGLRYPNTKPIYFDRLGTEFQTSGLIIKGKDGATVFLYLPGDVPPTESDVVGHKNLNTEEWVSVLKSLDNPDIFVQDKSGITKAIVRKHTRLIGANVQWKVYRRDDFTCQYCGRNDISLTVDHYLPIELGGTDEESNLKTSCRACNKKKGNLHPGEWEVRLGGEPND